MPNLPIENLEIQTGQTIPGDVEAQLKIYIDFVVQKTEEKLDIRIQGSIRETEEKLDIRIQEKETKTTEILAIFITLFTFISVNVQIFTKVSDLATALAFMILMTICSILLLSVLFLLINSKKSWVGWIALTLALILLTGSACLILKSQWNPRLNIGESESVRLK